MGQRGTWRDESALLSYRNLDICSNTRVPSGRVHNLINIAVYATLSAGTLYLSQQRQVVVTPAQALCFTVGFAVGTFMLSPDLDLAEGNVDSKRRWGPLGFLWAPYGMLFSHRGMSHTWILGPLTRLIYLALIALLLWGLVHFLVPAHLLAQLPRLPLPPLELHSPALQVLGVKVGLPLLVGYYLSQWLHLIADGVRPDHGLRHSGRKLRETARRLR